MECKVGLRVFSDPGIGVLIETSWNVKSTAALSPSSVISVLIETSWNVKVELYGAPEEGDIRINRNIVECKVLMMLIINLPFAY